MGCYPSKLRRNVHPSHRSGKTTASGQGVSVPAPSGGPQLGPVPHRDDAGQLITHQDFDLDRDALIEALDHMGRYLDNQGVTARVVTLGGAVNTIYLRSRPSTRVVHFFMDDPRSPLHTVIHEAACSAARSSTESPGVILGPDWFNNATQLLMDRQVQTRLVGEALQQNTVVHELRGQRGGLIVYAAPWAYAFCTKLDRLCGTYRKQYVMRDAVMYLHEYLRSSNKHSVTRGEVTEWCQEYRKKMTDAVLDEVNSQYSHAYNRQAIIRA
ncbi:hypothetical protein MMC25_007254 [Agyrium rufum]|nr:hypothetical protein [Agyrium rufum]